MKKLLVLLVLGILAYGCSGTYTFATLESAKPKNLKERNSMSFYTDTFDIKYNFWSDDGGVVCFDITNNIDKPLYVNWFKSKLFIGVTGYNYWDDEWDDDATIKSNTVGAFGAMKGSSSAISGMGISSTTTTIVKPEKITFIAPHSTIRRVFPLNAYKFWNNAKGYKNRDSAITVPNSLGDIIKKVCHINEYYPDNTPLSIRNFLSISTEENTNNEVYIDNNFWVSKSIIVDSAAQDTSYYKHVNFKPAPNAFYYFMKN